MGQAAGSSQRQPGGAGSFLCHLNLHLGGPAHDCADLCEQLLLLLLLLPPPPQDKDEGIEHLSKSSPHKGKQDVAQMVLKKQQKAFLCSSSRIVNRHSRAFSELSGGTRGAQPSNNKTPDKHNEGCPDWLPNTPAEADKSFRRIYFLWSISALSRATTTLLTRGNPKVSSIIQTNTQNMSYKNV